MSYKENGRLAKEFANFQAGEPADTQTVVEYIQGGTYQSDGKTSFGGNQTSITTELHPAMQAQRDSTIDYKWSRQRAVLAPVIYVPPGTKFTTRQTSNLNGHFSPGKNRRIVYGESPDTPEPVMPPIPTRAALDQTLTTGEVEIIPTSQPNKVE